MLKKAAVTATAIIIVNILHPDSDVYVLIQNVGNRFALPPTEFCGFFSFLLIKNKI